MHGLFEILLALAAVVVPLGLVWFLLARGLDPRDAPRRPRDKRPVGDRQGP